MTAKETKIEKSIRYLTSGRVAVRYVDDQTGKAEVHVTGDGGGEPYRVYREEDYQWSCDCPATVKCSHILAVMAVVPSVPIATYEGDPAELDSLLDG